MIRPLSAAFDMLEEVIGKPPVPTPEHLATCKECGSLFEVPAVAVCPECSSRQVRAVTLETRLAHEVQWLIALYLATGAKPSRNALERLESAQAMARKVCGE